MAEPSDQFQRLEEKLGKAIEIFKQAQADKRALEQQVEKLRADLKEHNQESTGLEKELIAMRKEREEVRGRLEKLAQRLDVLIKADTER